ncbi:class I SAM-dependent DNA methyltransferase [Sphingopyxis alaskensis]|uniref:class I SAM-dependent DNA methyltransferase n=1 Tax=Sphingopyxis alaskensis TaxID=117207 RepID=UPI00203FD1E2|nr:DNA methyltransferase [Sphingopyxis alaskensis]MCM3420148.1 hypothetical protein [Sphingopyxis alaskensis]
MALNTIAIEEALDQLVADVASGACTLHDFPFRVMEAFDASRNEVTKLRMKHPAGLAASDILWPKKLLFRAADTGQVQNTIEELKASLIGKKGAASKNAPRFLMSTDGDEFLAVDIKTGETPSFDRLADLAVNYDFLLPMFGVERYKPAPETAADVRAARHMAKFHDAIRDANPTWGADRVHDLNIFMTRLLFCMFAEDTGIFSDKLFLNTLRREAREVDGSDTQRVIEDIFLSLDVADSEARRARGVRSQRIASDFPYVNGGLFRDRTDVPVFNRRARRLLFEAAELQWDQIHADIFGSMIQAIIHTDMRADFGMHYTSVPNIMKVLEPLFLSSLREQLTAAGDNVKALEKLADRISRIRVFDPACGSGNFLIIAYRELRLIETEAFKRMRDVKRKGQLALADFQTGIKISNFYGIDPVDFACETAKLSLWISQYQMNRKLDEICTTPAPALPLTDAGSIVVGNALRKDWAEVCPPDGDAEVFVVGNPPYLGRANQDVEQKQDIIRVFSPFTKKFKKLDYVACWFALGGAYLRRGGTAFAFVATNSICQGEQVDLLWPHVLDKSQRIIFAHQSFRWSNSAAKNAAVICVIVGVGSGAVEPLLYSADRVNRVAHINPYLTAGECPIVRPRTRPISNLPRVTFGNQPIDGGGLLLTMEEATELRKQHPEASHLVKTYLGAQEFTSGKPRSCVWIPDDALELAQGIPPIARMIQRTKEFRLSSDRVETVELANVSHRFAFISCSPQDALIIPAITSERRPYVPMGFVSSDTVANNKLYVVPNAPLWLFSVVSSKLHTVWLGAVGGRMKSDYSYSNTLVYNTLPVPDLSAQQKRDLDDHALSILRVREPYIADGKTIAWLYGPETMPAQLLEAHRDLDDYLESIYIGRPFKDDIERLEHLFKLYARMTKTAATTA